MKKEKKDYYEEIEAAVEKSLKDKDPALTNGLWLDEISRELQPKLEEESKILNNSKLLWSFLTG